MLGQHCHDNLLNHVDKDGKPLCIVGCPLYDTINDGQHREADVLLRHKNGHRIPVHVRIYPIYGQGEVVGALEIFTRSAPSRYDDRLIESLTDRAMKDSLTNLPNRTYLESYIEYKLSEALRYKIPFSVIVADIDDLTGFNHYYSRVTGDVVLQSIAESFRSNFADPDKIGVWSAGMFVGVFSYCDTASIYSIADKVRMLASRSAVYYRDRYLGLTVSVGITVSHPNDTAQTLVARAEALMRISKQRGKNCSTVDIPPLQT